MQIRKEKLKEDFSRDIYWGRVYFSSNDNSKQSRVLIYTSPEYLRKLFGKNELEESDFDSWLDGIVKKWSILREDIFNQDVHYDVYATTPDAENRGLEYLLGK